MRYKLRSIRPYVWSSNKMNINGGNGKEKKTLEIWEIKRCM